MSDQEAFVNELPLPVAQLYLRGRNAKTPLERYLAAYYLWEGSLKLLASTAIVEYAGLEQHDPEIEERLHSLARPSTGHWWEFLRLLVPPLADTGDEEFAKIRAVLFDKRRDDMPRAASLDAMLREQLDGKSRSQATVKLTELFDRLVAFRNRELGHGAAGQQDAEHYNKLGRVLLLGMTELLKRVDVTAGRRLIYVADVRKRNTGDWEVDRFALRGETAWLLDSEILDSKSADDLPSPEHVYIDGPAGCDALRSLHPLVWYDAESSEAFFLNGRRGKKQADYLCYTSGNVVRRAGLQQTQRELLSRVLKVHVEGAEIDTWSAEVSDGEVDFSNQERSAVETIGEYELISLIGRGGMGEVYRAWQPSLGREVALKTLIRAGDEKAEARFAREIRALGKVEHPHLVKIFTASTHEDQWFYTMELIAGTDLDVICKRLASHGPAGVDKATWRDALSSAIIDTRTGERQLTKADSDDIARLDSVSSKTGKFALDPDAEFGDYVGEIVEFARQTAEAAHALHEVGVVHRDIKPGNIMIDGRGKAVLMDLGLAKLDTDGGRVTKTRQFVGTICYASPEQVMSSKELDRRSDVYSIGATLWELLALRPPFDASDESSTLKLMMQIQQKEPDSIRKYNPKVSRDLEAIVQKCMEKNADARYQTSRELAEDLARFQQGEPIVARHVGPVRRFAKRCRRHRAMTAMCSTIGLLLIVVTMLLLRPGGGEARESTPPDPKSWEVALATFPGRIDDAALLNNWWFEDDETAWKLLPVLRADLVAPQSRKSHKLTKGLATPDPVFEQLFTPEKEVFDENLRGVLGANKKRLGATYTELESRLGDGLSVKSLGDADDWLRGRSPQTPQILHSRAVLQFCLARLKKESNADASDNFDSAKAHFKKAMAEYDKRLHPLRMLCALDQFKLLLAMNERDTAFKNLETFVEESKAWQEQDVVKLMRIDALLKLSQHHRYERVFADLEAWYRDARSTVEALDAKYGASSLGEALRGLQTEVLMRHVWICMDHWRFDEAKVIFVEAADLYKVDKVTDAASARRKIAELWALHGKEMTKRYTGRPESFIEDVIEPAQKALADVRKLLPKDDERKGYEGELLDRISNAHERYADRLSRNFPNPTDNTLEHKYGMLQLAYAYRTHDRIAYKLLILEGMASDYLTEFSEVPNTDVAAITKQLGEVLVQVRNLASDWQPKDKKKLELHAKIAYLADRLREGTDNAVRGQALLDLCALLDYVKDWNDRESVEMRLMAWELLVAKDTATDAAKKHKDFLNAIEKSVQDQFDGAKEGNKARDFMKQYMKPYEELKIRGLPASSTSASSTAAARSVALGAGFVDGDVATVN